MAEIKVYLPDDLDLKFRKMAMTIYGYGRGSISKAATEALRVWCAEHQPPESVTGKIVQTEKSAETPTDNGSSHAQLQNEQSATRTASSARPA